MSLLRLHALDASAFLAVAAIAIAGYLWLPDLLPKAQVELAPEAGCNLDREPCRAALPAGGQLQIALSPQPVPLVKPVSIRVLAPADSRKVWVDFSGVAMNMGENRTALAQTTDGTWLGETTLPVCISGSMRWEVTVVVESAGRRMQVTFPLDTHAHPPPVSLENS